MFKKVLPSRRAAAADDSPFEIVTPPNTALPTTTRQDGKENVPQTQAQRPSVEGSKSWYSSGRGSVDLGPRKKSQPAIDKLEPQPTGGTTNVAFERMLASNFQVHAEIRQAHRYYTG